MAWKKGDVVKLKSGGPSMTVQVIQSGGAIFCTWFDGKKTASEAFVPEALIDASAPEIEVKFVQPRQEGD